MNDDAPITHQQLHEILDMVRRTVDAGAQSARRIEILEKATQETFEVLVSMQENQRRLLETFESQSAAQNKLNADLASLAQRLAAEIEQLKGTGSGLIM